MFLYTQIYRKYTIKSLILIPYIATLYNILYILSYLHVYQACDSVFNKKQKINIKTTVLL